MRRGESVRDDSTDAICYPKKKTGTPPLLVSHHFQAIVTDSSISLLFDFLIFLFRVSISFCTYIYIYIHLSISLTRCLPAFYNVFFSFEKSARGLSRARSSKGGEIRGGGGGGGGGRRSYGMFPRCYLSLILSLCKRL